MAFSFKQMPFAGQSEWYKAGWVFFRLGGVA